MQSLNVVIFVRSNVDWKSMTDETFLQQQEHHRTTKNLVDKLQEKVWRGVQTWNSVFDMSYYTYRQHLKEIAELSLNRVRDVDVICKNYTLAAKYIKWPDTVIIPVDDDDWFHPDIANIVREQLTDDTDVLHWNDAVLRTVPDQEKTEPATTFMQSRNWSTYLATNTYAVPTRTLQQFGPGQAERILTWHPTASKLLLTPEIRSKHLLEPYSVTNKTLGSITNLRYLTEPQLALRNIAALQQEMQVVPEKLAWATDFIKRTLAVNAQLAQSAHQSTPPVAPPLSTTTPLVQQQPKEAPPLPPAIEQMPTWKKRQRELWLAKRSGSAKFTENEDSAVE